MKKNNCTHEWYQSVPNTEIETYKVREGLYMGYSSKKDYSHISTEIVCMHCGTKGTRSEDFQGNVHVMWNDSNVNTDESLIDKLEDIRAKNNKSWMNLVRLAFKHSPNEARDIMKSIVDYDSQIGEITKQLSEGENNEK